MTSTTYGVFLVQRRNPADPCSNVWEGFACVDSLDAATASICRHHGTYGEAAELVQDAVDPDDRERMQIPGEKWGIVRDGLHWRVVNKTQADADPIADRTCPDCEAPLTIDWKCTGCGAQWDELSEEDDEAEDES